jgi:exosome complex RNA-binding protein Csl4
MKCMHWVLFLSFLSVVSVAVVAQPASQMSQREILPGDRVFGTVTAVGKDSVTISPQGGNKPNDDFKTPVTINVSDNTRIHRQRDAIKLNEIKKGDTVYAVGHRAGNTVQATMLGVFPSEMVVRKSLPAGGKGSYAAGGFKPEEMGSKYILGTVKAIDKTRLTIARTDGKSQEIEVDGNTTFRRSQQNITFPEIKVGDFVMGRGELKNNVFVPRVLNVGPPQPQLQSGSGAGSSTQTAPATPAPTQADPAKSKSKSKSKSEDKPPQE